MSKQQPETPYKFWVIWGERMIEDIEAIFDVLQQLDIKPTQHNTTILCGVFNSLKKIHNELEESANVGNSAENGAAVDSCGRDGN